MVDPNQKVLFLGLRQNSETYTFAAEIPGRYEYCFKNGMSTVTEKTISFDVMVDERTPLGPNPSKTADDIALDAEIAELMHNLRSVRDNQQYMRVRERAHRDSMWSERVLRFDFRTPGPGSNHGGPTRGRPGVRLQLRRAPMHGFSGIRPSRWAS